MSQQPATVKPVVITIPDAPRIPGLVFRGFAGLDADVPGMWAVSDAARSADGEIERNTLEGLRTHYAHLERCDLATDAIVAEIDGQIVAYGRTEWADTNDGERWYDATCFVHPSVRGRGIGTAMLAWTEERRVEIARQHRAAGTLPGDRPLRLTCGINDLDKGGGAILGAAGYEVFRHFYSMRRPDLEAIPDAPLPDGLEIRPIAREDSAMRPVFDADSEAFRDHFGWVDDGEATYRSIVEDPDTDPARWIVAFDGDEVAGGILNGIHTGHDGRPEGWLDSIFTRRPWRRRGLARALIVRSLVLLRDRGMTNASLGVDAANENAALQLYESCGFRAVSSSTAYRKTLTPRTLEEDPR